MTAVTRKHNTLETLDLSALNVEELRRLVEQARRKLDILEFEEGLQRAVKQHATRDPRVIRI